MTLLAWFVSVIVLAAVGIALDRYFRTSAPVEPKPFGLAAYEAHGLQKASGDVLKAVVATISFLGHPFTVVEEAREEKASAAASSARALARVEENLEEIRDLQEENVDLQERAKASDARASAMDALVAQVSSVVGGK